MNNSPDPIAKILEDELYIAHLSNGIKAPTPTILGKAKALTAIRQEVERICLEVIGGDEVRPQRGPKRNGVEQGLRRARNKVRAEQRQRLAAALRGLEGKEL